MNPKYPFYIVSKLRADSRLTVKAFDKMNIPYSVVIDEDDYDSYAAVMDKNKIIIMPKRYYDEYDTCDNIGDNKAKGPGAARNFVWDDSIKRGFKRHWVFDDNVRSFMWANNNLMVCATDGTIFKAMEDFVDRYTNVAIAGPNYAMFAPRRSKHQPFTLNTRIYSMLLIKNDIPYRWRGRYNEDTDLSLRVLKDGWCTIQFNAFLGAKISTQVLKGGNSDNFYFNEGTYNKSKMQKDLHPDVSTIVYKFNRVHHVVDYKPFKKNKLIRDPNVVVTGGINNYGMEIRNK